MCAADRHVLQELALEKQPLSLQSPALEKPLSSRSQLPAEPHVCTIGTCHVSIPEPGRKALAFCNVFLVCGRYTLR